MTELLRKITDFFGIVWTKLLSVLQACVQYVVEWFQRVATYFLNQVLAALPTGWQQAITDYVPYLEMANAWCPLLYCFGLVVLYYSFVLVVIVIRHLRKLVPGWSG